MRQRDSKQRSIARFAVFGDPISHSLSPAIHQAFAEQLGIALQYDKVKVPVSAFEVSVRDFFKQGGMGLNITTPHKHTAFQMADQLTPRAKLAQASNTLWMFNGELHADNTDGIGFVRDISRYLDLTGKAVLILGVGGTTQALVPALLDTGLRHLIVANRTLSKAKALQSRFPALEIATLETVPFKVDLVINATTSSLSGGRLDLPTGLFSNQPFCYDVGYQQQSSFLTQGKAAGCQVSDGLGMLVEQAAASFYVWHGKRPKISPDFFAKLPKKA